MNKKEFIDRFYQELKKNKKIDKTKKPEYAEKIINIFFDSVVNALRVGDKVDLRKFGVFQAKNYNFPKKKKNQNKSPVFKMSQIIRKKLASKEQ